MHTKVAKKFVTNGKLSYICIEIYANDVVYIMKNKGTNNQIKIFEPKESK